MYSDRYRIQDIYTSVNVIGGQQSVISHITHNPHTTKLALDYNSFMFNIIYYIIYTKHTIQCFRPVNVIAGYNNKGITKDNR